ncbi:sensor histidine kinase [Oscillochloris sp. ZM17-4]|uniref:sensor histidine kinase n=1 Tax=Oscillochloris sp. ZM17-4 TaxID=2866714 RepID=UPI001C72B6DC|nr:sensor histidine kinase [Oscillochloris sp. ZM17-4]MBX0329939.1 sensor histidine kinase [Oscillochloris sp. ZM17-4]
MEHRRPFISLPIYIFITLLLGALGLSACVPLWQAGGLARAWPVALLFIAHIGLYWLNIWQPKRTGWWALYYVAQTALIVTLVFVLHGSAAPSSIWGSFLGSAIICQIGEALGWWGNSRTALLLGLFYGGLGLTLLALLLDGAGLASAVGNLLLNGGVVVLLMVLFNQQLIARERAIELAESLERANAQLAAAAGTIAALTLQAERQRMARELHDTLAQGVAGLVLQLEAVKAHLAADRSARAAAIVDQALARARSTLAESRAAIDDLRRAPAPLAEAIRETSERFSQATGIPCQLDLALAEDEIDQDVAGHALHIVREALSNVARHAQATQVAIRCGAQQGSLELEVCDNGRGFDPRQERGEGHYGLLGMRERARLTGGALSVESAAARGTRVHLRAPSAPGGGAR